MKYELPIAITLLATGCLLWVLQSDSNSSRSAASTVKPPAAEVPALNATSEAHSAEANAPVWKPPVSPQELARRTTTTQSESTRILHAMAAAFERGPSTTGNLEIECHLFDRSHLISGRFWQAGQGSRKSRMELIPKTRNPIKVTQVCDGRTLFRLLQRGQVQRLTFTRLDLLENKDAGLIEATLPATWVGTGSVDKLFAHLAEAFDFAVPQRLDSKPNHFELTGTWKPQFLSKLMVDRIDHRKLSPKVHWDLLPPQMPHGVKIQVSNLVGDSWTPDEVNFFQFKNGDSKENKIELAMSIRFSDVREQAINPELFSLQANDVPSTDETDLYNERIELMAGPNRVADGSSSESFEVR